MFLIVGSLGRDGFYEKKYEKGDLGQSICLSSQVVAHHGFRLEQLYVNRIDEVDLYCSVSVFFLTFNAL